MEQGNPKDLAAAYVLGALEPDETRAFEARLETSDSLRHEVAELREVCGLLALGAAPVPRDDQVLKTRLLGEVRQVRPGRSTSGPRPRRRDRWILGLAAAAAIVIAVVQTVRTGDLGRRLALVEGHADSLATRLARREATLDRILEPSTSLILLTATGERPPGIQLFWNRASDSIVLHAFNFPPAAAGRVYQLWFLHDGAPVPGGTFNSDPDGRAVVTLQGPPAAIELLGAAVTEEPVGGSSLPTSAIIVSGSRSE